MKTTLYLIRHGQSEANEKNIFLGQGNMDLTKLGKHQAEMTAEYLKRSVIPDVIYSSDLGRAYETAECTAKIFNLSIVKEKGLREIDAGFWDKLNFDELERRYKAGFDLWKSDVGNSRCDGGESVAELSCRIISTIEDIAKRHRGKTVLIFTHAMAVRAFACHCLGKSLGELKEVPWAANASVTQVEYDGEFKLIEYGVCDFMGDGVTRLPSGV